MRITGPMAVLVSACVMMSGCASAPRAQPDAQSFSVTVDYDQSLDDLIRAGGYRWVYSEINSINFPSTQSGNRSETVRLVRLDPVVPIDRLLSQEKARGLRPADLRELLAFGRTYPDIQLHASIVGFGSFRVYPTITYINFGTGPMDQWTVRSLQNFYPTLIHGLLGRSVVLMQDDMIPDFDPPGFYGCFVQEAPTG